MNPIQPLPSRGSLCAGDMRPSGRYAEGAQGREDRMLPGVHSAGNSLSPLHAPALPVPDSHSPLQDANLQVTQGNTFPHSGPQYPPLCTSLDWHRSRAYWCPHGGCVTPSGHLLSGQEWGTSSPVGYVQLANRPLPLSTCRLGVLDYSGSFRKRVLARLG